MKVKAIDVGFYGGFRRRVGATFDVPDGTKGAWFVPVDEGDSDAEQANPDAGDKPKQGGAPGKGTRGGKAPQTLSEVGKQGASTFNDAMSGGAATD